MREETPMKLILEIDPNHVDAELLTRIGSELECGGTSWLYEHMTLLRRAQMAGRRQIILDGCF